MIKLRCRNFPRLQEEPVPFDDTGDSRRNGVDTVNLVVALTVICASALIVLFARPYTELAPYRMGALAGVFFCTVLTLGSLLLIYVRLPAMICSIALLVAVGWPGGIANTTNPPIDLLVNQRYIQSGSTDRSLSILSKARIFPRQIRIDASEDKLLTKDGQWAKLRIVGTLDITYEPDKMLELFRGKAVDEEDFKKELAYEIESEIRSLVRSNVAQLPLSSVSSGFELQVSAFCSSTFSPPQLGLLENTDFCKKHQFINHLKGSLNIPNVRLVIHG